MKALPSGTVTFLMTDVEASTRLWQQSVEDMEEGLAGLDQDIHRYVESRGGVVIKSRGEGDSHFAVFDCTTAAMLAAVDLQRARAEVIGPRVRIALHTGEAEPRDGDYLGLLVNRTARLRSTAHAGQIVLSRVVAELVEDVEGVVVRSLGLHRVRDFGRPLELFQACADGIPTDFPPPVTLDTANTSIMTVVFVDQLDSSERARREPHIMGDWQRPLFRALRATADAHDGRFLKLTGDGCLVAFEDPRAALGFAHHMHEQTEFCLRTAVSAGLVEVVEGELSGLPLFEAASKLKHTRPGECWVAPVVAALVGDSCNGAPIGQAASELLSAPQTPPRHPFAGHVEPAEITARRHGIP